MTDCISGRLQTLEISTDGESTWHPVDGIVDCTLNLTMDEIECTSHDSAGEREYEPNLRSATVDGNARYSAASAGQEALLSAYFGGTKFAVRFRMEEEDDAPQYVYSSAFVTSYNLGGPLEGTASVDFSIRLSGAVAVSAQ